MPTTCSLYRVKSVAVANPAPIRAFAKTIGPRAKTDPSPSTLAQFRAMAPNLFRRRQRLDRRQPQGCPERLVIVDHGRFIAAIDHMCLCP